MNSLFLLAFQQIAYLFQAGIAEWDASTTYYIGSMVNVNGATYVSKTNANTNNAVTDASNWQLAAGEQPGFIKDFAGPTANIPTGYLACDGSAVSRTTYANLYASIGNYWGAGDGSTTFNLPNFKGKVAVGYDAGQTEFNAVGKADGEKTHTLTTDELASHAHHIQSWEAEHPGSDYVVFSDLLKYNPPSSSCNGVNFNSDAAGGGGAHNNLQPYATVNKVIKY